MSDGIEYFRWRGRETAVSAHDHIRCDGSGGALGHPAEFITLERAGEAICKYCSRRFLHSHHPEAETVRAEAEPVPAPAGHLARLGYGG